MGVVYKAREIGLNRIVALKMIISGEFANPMMIRRFQIEVETVALFDHPGIVPIYHVGHDQGRHYYAMGYIEGMAAAALARKRVRASRSRCMPEREAAELIAQVADAIQHAHAHNIVHRDLKPANILLDAQGKPKVTDFGLAKTLESDSGLTASGQIMGTPSFMAPEQAAGKIREVGPPADIYGLGSILYCLLTGRPPFQSPTQMETLMQVIHQEPVAPRRLQPKLDRDLETICLKCLAKAPSHRYASARELADDLRRFLADRPIHARPPRLVYRLSKFMHRHRHALASIAMAMALGASLLLLSSWMGRRARAEKVEELIAEGRSQLDHAVKARAAGADLLFESAMQSFAAARAIDPGSTRAGEALVDFYLRRFDRALEVGEFDAARALILPLRSLDNAAAFAPRIAELERRALGTSRWQIDSTPSGSDIRLTRLDTDLLPEKPKRLGRTPLAMQDIAPGDYLLTVTHPDYVELRQPIRIARGEERVVNLVLLDQRQIPDGMVYVPGGPFLFGDPQAGTLRSVDVPGFLIDRTEVTGAQYERFVQETGAAAPDRWEGAKTCPPIYREGAVHNVSWYDAYAYARWAGKRLPTEIEWEKAARGVDGRSFPWGARFEARRATSRDVFPTQGLLVGRHRDGASPYGCLDMAGNVWEWTLDRERLSDADRVIRGGASSSTPDELVTYRRKGAPPGGSSYGGLNLLGFRCVKPLHPGSGAPPLLDALTIGPDLADAAEYFTEEGRWSEARECCRRLLDLNPRSIPGNFQLAACLMHEEKLAESLAALRIVFFQKFKYKSHTRARRRPEPRDCRPRQGRHRAEPFLPRSSPLVSGRQTCSRPWTTRQGENTPPDHSQMGPSKRRRLGAARRDRRRGARPRLRTETPANAHRRLPPGPQGSPRRRGADPRIRRVPPEQQPLDHRGHTAREACRGDRPVHADVSQDLRRAACPRVALARGHRRGPPGDRPRPRG